MLNVNMNNVEERHDGEYEKPTPGGYKVVITKVENDAKKQGLKVEYDFAEGKFKDYYKDLNEKFGFWGGTMWCSYKEKAMPFFKGFVTAVEKSNDVKLIDESGDIDEAKLVGLVLGVVLYEEDYKGNNGEIKQRLSVAQKMSTERLASGNYKIPEPKKIARPEDTEAVDFSEVNADLPF